MTTSVDNHVSKDDDMKMFFKCSIYSTVSLSGVHLFTIHLYSIVCPHWSIAMFQRMKILKCPSGISLFHRQSWWCASFQYSFKCNYMPTSVDNHVSKDDDMMMSFRYILVPQSVLVVCIFSSFIQMQQYAHINRYPCFKGWWYKDVLQVHLCSQLLPGFTKSWVVFEQHCP